MSVLNRKDKAIIVLILLIAVSLPYFIPVLTQTPPGPNTLEHGQGINFPTITATTGYYLGATELTDRLQGTWDVALTAPTLDTGQGANELYDMDQNVLTTSDVDFNSVNATEFYLNSENVTEHLEGNYTDSGLITPWLDLDGVNRTTWPSGVSGGVEELSFVYEVFKNATATYMVSGDTGLIVGQNADDDTLFEYIDGNTSEGDLVFVKGGNYLIDSFSKDTAFNIKGVGENTVFNFTNPNWSIDINADTEMDGVQLYSNQDGVFHIKVDASLKLSNYYLNFPLDTASEAGVFRFQGGMDDHVELYNGRIRAGKGSGRFFLFSWHVPGIDHIYIDNFVIESIDVGYSGYARLFIPMSSTWFKTIRATNIDILYWEAGSNSDSAIFYYVQPTGDALIYDNVFFRREAGNFSDAGDQQLEFAPLAESITYNNMKLHYQSHIYGSLITQVNNLELFGGVGTSSVWSAFDCPVIGDYPKFAEFSNLHLKNASLTINDRYRKVTVIGAILEGSRIVLAQENASGYRREVILQAIQWERSSTDIFTDAIELMNSHTYGETILKIFGCDFDGNYDFIQMGNVCTEPLLIHIDGLTGEYLSASKPELFNGAGFTGRDDNVTIWLFNSRTYSDAPPLDDANPIREGDRISGFEWIDVDTNVTTRSETVLNFTIPSGSSSVTINHDMPARTIWSSYQFSLTSDPANCTTPWATWADFTSTQLTIRIGTSAGEKNVDDDVTGIVKFELKP